MDASRERVLVYDRIDANRRKTVFILALFAFISLPAVAYVTLYLTFLVALAGLMAISTLGAPNANGLLEGEGLILGIFASIFASIAIVLAVAFLLYNLAAAAVLRFTGSHEVSPGKEMELRRSVENLCIGAGLPQPRLYVVESAAANAFSTGMDPSHASLVVSRGLLKLLDRAELEGVVAHELSQIGNYDTRLATVLAVCVGMLRLPFAIVAAIVRLPFRIHWLVGVVAVLYLLLPLVGGIPLGIGVAFEVMRDDPVAGVLLLLGMLLPPYVLFAAPLIAVGVRVIVLRRRVLLADADAFLLTRHGEGLARALAKLAAATHTPMKVAAATAHLWVVESTAGEDALVGQNVFDAPAGRAAYRRSVRHRGRGSALCAASRGRGWRGLSFQRSHDRGSQEKGFRSR